TASRSVLLGIVPVCTHTPPIVRFRSTMATFLRSLAAQIAPFWPAGPLPMTTRSYSMEFIPGLSLPGASSALDFQTGPPGSRAAALHAWGLLLGKWLVDGHITRLQ